jgi:peptidoglycan/LPS O-acetylase OafA/YrhL
VIVLFYGANWSRAFYGIPAKWLGHTWSLSIEEQFYFVWPFLLLLIIKYINKFKVICLSFVVVTVSIYRYVLLQHNASTDRLYFGSDTRLDTILVGCLLALILYETNKINDVKLVLSSYKKYIDISTFLSVAFIMFILVSFRMDMIWFYSYGMLLVAVSSAIIILNIIATPDGSVARLLSSRWLVVTGKISYGIYIWHWPVFYYLHEKTAYNTYPKFIFGIILSYLIAALSFWSVEQPMLKYRNRF